MQNKLTALENKIIKCIIEHISEKNLVYQLNEQYKNLKVTKRIYTGVGFYTEFSLENENVEKDKKLSIAIGNVGANLNGLKNGAGFILYIKNGEITMLEGYSYDEVWPQSEKIKELYLINNDGSIKKIKD